MATDTWNFSTWQLNDCGPLFTRGRGGQLLSTGPGAFGGASAQPFVESFTYIFSFFARTGWSADFSSSQYLFSMGRRGVNTCLDIILVMDTAGTSELTLVARNGSSFTTRYLIDLGDEDGTSNLAFDKWYQCGVHMSDTTISFALNGTTTPKTTTTTNSPGSLALNTDPELIFLYAGPASHNASVGDPGALTSGYPSVIAGPFALSTQVLDFSSSTVRGRIWDANGDFKNPGENGSLWFGDTYGDNIPNQYSHDGSIRALKENTMVWRQFNGGSPGNNNFPGGLRKQLEA